MNRSSKEVKKRVKTLPVESGDFELTWLNPDKYSVEEMNLLLTVFSQINPVCPVKTSTPIASKD